MQRYSRKRESILQCLRRTKTHPSAEWIYQQLKPEYPDLSLATVYRNLNQLKQQGLVRSMGTVMGQERFDGDIHPHSHVICACCGRIMDVGDIPVPRDLADRVAEMSCFTVSGLQFTGICRDCRESREDG